MSTPDGQGRGFGDELTNFLMIALIAVFGVAAVLRAAGSIAAFLSGAAQPQVGIAGGVAMLFNPTKGLDPRSWTRCRFGYAASARVADVVAA